MAPDGFVRVVEQGEEHRREFGGLEGECPACRHQLRSPRGVAADVTTGFRPKREIDCGGLVIRVQRDSQSRVTELEAGLSWGGAAVALTQCVVSAAAAFSASMIFPRWFS